MPPLPDVIIAVLAPFAELFSSAVAETMMMAGVSIISFS